mgnify:CR=1 FL=1
MNLDTILQTSDQAEIVARYTKRLAEHGPTMAALNVGKPEYYARQHEAHFEVMPQAASSVIDVGCGLGSFLSFLLNKGCKLDYLGIDIVPDLIATASTSYPDAIFECRDIFKDGLPKTADHIVMCQVFNSRFKSSDNAAVIKEAIKICFEKAAMSVSIDMLSKYVNYEEKSLFYSDPEKMFAYAKTLTPYVALKHDYLPHHFTLALYKK